MTEVYTASSVVDVIDALPTLFGFVPQESFIGIVTTGPRRRFGFRLRLDIPDADQIEDAGAAVAGHLNRYASDGVILIAVSNDHASADALMNAVLDGLGPVPIVATLRADDERVWTYDSAGTIDETDPGLERPRTTGPAIAQAVAAGQQIWSSREALAAQFAPTATPHETAEDAKAAKGGGEASIAELTAATTDIVATAATAGRTMSDGEIHTLAVAAQVLPTRDAMWALMTRTNAENHAEMWRLVATRTAVPGAYALAGFGYWLSGDGARAAMAIEQATAADPEHAMANLVGTVLTLGVNPAEWNGIPI